MDLLSLQAFDSLLSPAWRGAAAASTSAFGPASLRSDDPSPGAAVVAGAPGHVAVARGAALVVFDIVPPSHLAVPVDDLRCITDILRRGVGVGAGAGRLNRQPANAGVLLHAGATPIASVSFVPTDAQHPWYSHPRCMVSPSHQHLPVHTYPNGLLFRLPSGCPYLPCTRMARRLRGAGTQTPLSGCHSPSARSVPNHPPWYCLPL